VPAMPKGLVYCAEDEAGDYDDYSRTRNVPNVLATGG